MGLDVGSGAEASFARTPNGDHTDVRVIVQEFQCLNCLTTQDGIDRIDLAGAIKDDPAHAVDALDLYCVFDGPICHGCHAPAAVTAVPWAPGRFRKGSERFVMQPLQQQAVPGCEWPARRPENAGCTGSVRIDIAVRSIAFDTWTSVSMASVYQALGVSGAFAARGIASIVPCGPGPSQPGCGKRQALISSGTRLEFRLFG